MIQLSKVHAAGYLRAGEILEILNKDKSALDVYADGIKQLEPDNPQFEVRIDPYGTGEGGMRSWTP